MQEKDALQTDQKKARRNENKGGKGNSEYYKEKKEKTERKERGRRIKLRTPAINGNKLRNRWQTLVGRRYGGATHRKTEKNDINAYLMWIFECTIAYQE